MPRHPTVWLASRRIARATRPLGYESIEAKRASLANREAPLGAVAGGLTISEHTIGVADGSITARVHTPAVDGPRPAHVLLHAGGFCYGGAAELDGLAALYARSAGCVVVVPNYRLAPEHPYPAAPEDAYATVQWLVEHAEELGVDARRISIGGISAGGCVATVVALMARDRGGPSLVFQLLEIPVTDVTASCQSVHRFGKGYVLTEGELKRNYELYVPDPARRRDDYVSPLFAADLSGLPPAMVITVQYDPLRDEGEAYARRLIEAGVPVQAIRVRGHVHSSTYTTMPSAVRIQRQAAAALSAAYGRAESR
jgi:acetyl esterase